MEQNTKWVSIWGNAVSIAENRPERYAKDITLRYPVISSFSCSAVRRYRAHLSGENHGILRGRLLSRFLRREYTCLTYESYGLSGERRFHHEVPTDGADTVIIQQGINDIIHPVGVENNVFRPMSDLPTVDELINGLKGYIAKAKSYGYKVYVGTLLPMGGWRTDAPFRQEMRHAYNEFIRTTNLIDGCIDFDKALRDPVQPDYFFPEYDSGDHLHPNAKGYQRMAAEIPAELLK